MFDIVLIANIVLFIGFIYEVLKDFFKNENLTIKEIGSDIFIFSWRIGNLLLNILLIIQSQNVSNRIF